MTLDPVAAQQETVRALRPVMQLRVQRRAAMTSLRVTRAANPIQRLDYGTKKNL
jgi:hypothetical protein